MKVNLTNIEIANIIAYSRTETSVIQDSSYKFSITFAWNLKKNLNKLMKIYDDFAQMQNEIMAAYSDDEHSDITGDQRKVKYEYLVEYNNKMNELYCASNEVEIAIVKLDKLVPGGISGLDNSGMSIMDLDILSFMIDESETESKESITAESE